MGKKIGILTFHRAINYGAILQTYALYKELSKSNNEVAIIDYRAPFNEERFEKKKLKDFLHVRQLYYVFFRNGYERYNRDTFNGMYSKIKFSSTCYSRDELKAVCDYYDQIVCGSDQVWNIACTSADDSYFLPFVTNRNKKTSYAASIGFEKIPSQYEQSYKKWLSDFESIAVREKTAVDIVKDLTNRCAICVVDPTLLLSYQEWLKIADHSIVPKEKYILMYLMAEDRELIDFAKRLAAKRKCRIIYITNRLFNVHGVDNVRNVTPEQWIGLFDKAESVVTNSFHGTAFSINFNKEFFVKYIPRSIANTRLKCILEEYQLENREISHFNSEPINYATVNHILEKAVNQSKQFISTEILGR